MDNSGIDIVRCLSFQNHPPSVHCEHSRQIITETSAITHSATFLPPPFSLSLSHGSLGRKSIDRFLLELLFAATAFTSLGLGLTFSRTCRTQFEHLWHSEDGRSQNNSMFTVAAHPLSFSLPCQRRETTH